VAYVMLDLARPHGKLPARDIHAYVTALENWLIATLAIFGIRGERRPGRVGVWVADGAAEAKIAAVGVRITKWVSWHGISLNVCPDLSHFSGIVPCGISGHGVTSLQALGVASSIEEVGTTLREEWSTYFA
jgi:lipoyl(octanoyl) transferase